MLLLHCQVLAVKSCASLLLPSHRVVLASYVGGRGLSLVFSEALAVPLEASALETFVFPRENERADCLAEALSRTAGANGWNDPRAQLALESSVPVGLEEQLHSFPHSCWRRTRLARNHECRGAV